MNELANDRSPSRTSTSGMLEALNANVELRRRCRRTTSSASTRVTRMPVSHHHRRHQCMRESDRDPIAYRRANHRPMRFAHAARASTKEQMGRAARCTNRIGEIWIDQPRRPSVEQKRMGSRLQNAYGRHFLYRESTHQIQGAHPVKTRASTLSLRTHR